MHGKWPFFDENHRLRPLQKLRFFGIFSKLYFSCLENILFSPQCHETFFFFCFILQKKTNDGKWPFFDKNHGLTRLENFDFFYFFKTFIFHVYKTFFCIQNITKQSFLSYFAEKKLSCLLPFPVVLWWELGLAFCTAEKHFEGSLSLRKSESKGKQHGWQAQYGLGWVYPLFVPMGKGWGYFSKICMGWFSLPHAFIYQF